MNTRYNDYWSRRKFLSTAALASTGAVLGLRPKLLAAEPPPETTRIRLIHSTSICYAPQYLAEDLLRGEGFTDVQYLKRASGKTVASGEADITMLFSAPQILLLDAGEPIVMLAGIHVGCFELFGTDQVRTIRELKGKRVAVGRLGNPTYVLASIIMATVGLDPRKDINWVTRSQTDAARLLAEKKIDALLAAGSPPYPQELRAKNIGHTLLNSTTDRPWSQYFCCMVGANREFVRKHPVATKRALRAILKAANICTLEPERTARSLVGKGYAKSGDYDYVLQAMKEIPYSAWRDFDPEDAVRFYALRLHEVGMIKATPQKIIAQGTDWRFLRELKKELKA